MDLESIKTFLILSKTLNYTRTADILFVSQSTVSSRISELEKELDLKLFERTNRNVELTDKGRIFAEYAQKMTELTSASLQHLSSMSKYEDDLRIGCTNTIYECHLGKELKKQLIEHPERALSVTIGLSADLNKKLIQGLLDEVYSFIPINKAKFNCEVYKQDDMVLVTDYNNRKYTRGITREELTNENYIMCDFALREAGEFIRNIFPPYHRFPLEIDDCLKVIPFLLDTDLMTFLPMELARPLISEKKLRKIKLLDIELPKINSYRIRSRKLSKD